MRSVVILLLVAGFGPSLHAQNPKELGSVTWLRDLERGLARARKLDRPVFLQFQEVPG